MVGPISFVCVLIEHCSKINQLVQAILMSIDCPFTNAIVVAELSIKSLKMTLR